MASKVLEKVREKKHYLQKDVEQFWILKKGILKQHPSATPPDTSPKTAPAEGERKNQPLVLNNRSLNLNGSAPVKRITGQDKSPLDNGSQETKRQKVIQKMNKDGGNAECKQQ